MTDPKTPGSGGDNDTAAHPGLMDKAKDVLARTASTGDESTPATPSAETSEKAPAIKPVVKGAPTQPPAAPAAPAPVAGAKAPAKPAAAKPAKAEKAADADADATRTAIPRRTSSVDEPTQAMAAVKAPARSPKPAPAPTAPPVPERPLFADAPRTAPTTAVPAAAPAPAAAAPTSAPAARTGQTGAQRKTKPGAPRKARLRLVKVDPWSVMKTSFLLSLAFGVVLFVAVAMIWLVLGAAGVWDSVNDAVKNFDESTTFDITQYLGTSRVLGLAALVAVVDVVLMTALATLSAFLYNMSASLLGGVELTFAEEKN